MEVQIKHQPSFALAVVTMAGNEQIRVEPGAMVSFSDGVTVQTKAEGGLLGGLKRMVGGESFFQNTYTAPGQGGEILLASQLPGDMRVVEITPNNQFMLQSGAYVASESGVETDTRWGGAKGFFGGAGLLLLRVTGSGTLLIACYGAIEERVLGAGQRYTVDTGHIVGFDSTVQFKVRGMGNLKSTFLSGEGLVCELTGPGRVMMQTRSEEALLGWLIPKLPQRSNS